MKTTKQKIEVMQAFEDGVTVICDDAYEFNKESGEFAWNWEEFDYVVKPIDWSKVAIDTPVVCTDANGKRHKRYFARNEEGIYCFYYGKTSRTTQEACTGWAKVELDTEAQSIINWIKNTGEAPDCENVLIKLRNNKFRAGLTNLYAFEINRQKTDIIEYAIID